MLLMYGFNQDNIVWIKPLAETTIENMDKYNSSMFGKTTLEDIKYIETSEKISGINRIKSGAYAIHKSINGKHIYFGAYKTEEKAIEVLEFLKDNNWDKELLNVMKEMGEIPMNENMLSVTIKLH